MRKRTRSSSPVSARRRSCSPSAATYRLGGGTGIWDDGHFARPGSLDDGKDLLPQTTISLAQANAAAAARGQSGALGQVDLEHDERTVVYTVDIGNQEVQRGRRRRQHRLGHTAGLASEKSAARGACPRRRRG